MKPDDLLALSLCGFIGFGVGAMGSAIYVTDRCERAHETKVVGAPIIGSIANVECKFDNSAPVEPGDLVTLSTSIAGDCHVLRVPVINAPPPPAPGIIGTLSDGWYSCRVEQRRVRECDPISSHVFISSPLSGSCKTTSSNAMKCPAEGSNVQPRSLSDMRKEFGR